MSEKEIDGAFDSIKRLRIQKDAQIAELEAELATMRADNERLTKENKQLKEDNTVLELKVKDLRTVLIGATDEPG